MKLSVFTLSATALLLTSAIVVAQQPVTGPRAASSAPVAEFLTAAPSGSVTVTNWYKQNVNDLSNAKIGDVSDVLVSQADGRITAVVIGVGGFLGMGEKEVGVPFSAVKREVIDGKVRLTINTTKEALAAAKGLKYDGNTSSWILASSDLK